jgi:tetratricopeptide (TPR) repeat protein
MTIRAGALAVPLLLALASLAPLPSAAEETILVFERKSRTLQHPPPGQAGLVQGDTTRAEITVVLGDRRLGVYEPDRAWIYDFDRHRVFGLDPKTGTYSDWSLFGFVAFSEMELDHRLSLRSRLMAGRGGAGPSVLELETLFSMKAPRTKPGPRESLSDSSTGGEVRFYTNGVLAAAASASDSPLTPARLTMFERFLLYRCHLHPEARRALVRSGKVPQRLFFRYMDFDQETQVMLTLKRISSAPEANDPITGSQRADVMSAEHAALGRLLEACRSCSEPQANPWMETSRRFESEALAQGRYLDAALARTERSLACEPSVAWPNDVERRARADASLSAYRAGQHWKDSTSAAAALGKLAGIDRGPLTKAYLLDLTAGRARFAAGDHAGGIQLLLRAVNGNPCLAGAWQELARAYLAGYEPVLAWTCFDAARAVSPNRCDALAEGERLERALLERHPDFFE